MSPKTMLRDGKNTDPGFESGRDEALKAALDASVAQMLRPVSLGLGVYYALIAAAHAAVAPGGVAFPMTLTAAVTAVVLLTLFLALPRWSVKGPRAHSLLAGVAFLALWNILLHLHLTSDPLQSTNLMLLVLGAGFFFLSPTWLAAIIAAAVTGWAIVCWGAPPSPGWTHFGFGLLTTCALSVLAFVVRRRSLRRIEGLRLQNEHQNRLLRDEIKEREQVEEALQTAQAELETRVRLRTAELRESNEKLRAEMAERQRAEEDRRKLEARVQYAQKFESLGVLAGGIAHDFNNLLAVILGNTELALGELPKHSAVRRRIEDVQGAAVRAAGLTRQMMAYSGQGLTITEELSLNALIEEVAHPPQGSIAGQVSLQLRLAEDLPPIQGDSGQIRQVLTSLIANASEAIGDRSGTITVRTGLLHAAGNSDAAPHWDDAQLGDCVALEVSDTGCGMAPDVQRKIFDPFYTTKFTGRGLGLAAVLGIVRGHHGDIKVHSEVGKGTTVKILFPVGSRDAPARAESARLAQAWHNQGMFLVVDDEELVRSLVKMRLEREGFSVLVAGDGEVGVQLFRQHSDQIVGVLLDLVMPRMNGDEALRQMRRIRPDVRVIVASGYAEKEAVDRLVDGGLTGFLQKPFRLDRLMEEVRQVVGSSPPRFTQ
jgi:signal transduction histidine kinase/CheY-like chemotaxis protein